MSDVNWDLAPESADSLKQSVSDVGNLQWFKGLYVHIGDDNYAHTVSSKWKIIATRPQKYEKARAEKLEEWTHLYNEHEACRVLVGAPDRFGIIVIDTAANGYIVCGQDEIKPIKPQITKAQAYDMFMSGYTAEHIKETYDVVGESSEVQS